MQEIRQRESGVRSVFLEYFIKTYKKENEVVMDNNCMGAGSCGVACRNTGRRFLFSVGKSSGRKKLRQVAVALRIFYKQNTAYNGIDFIPFSKPKFFAEIRME